MWVGEGEGRTLRAKVSGDAIVVPDVGHDRDVVLRRVCCELGEKHHRPIHPFIHHQHPPTEPPYSKQNDTYSGLGSPPFDSTPHTQHLIKMWRRREGEEKGTNWSSTDSRSCSSIAGVAGRAAPRRPSGLHFTRHTSPQRSTEKMTH